VVVTIVYVMACAFCERGWCDCDRCDHARCVDVAVVVMWLRLGWSFGDGHNRGSRNGVVPVLMVAVRERDGGGRSRCSIWSGGREGMDAASAP
jgi:hypothetical protein